MKIKGIHHIALIVRNYEQSKYFYTSILGLEIIRETYRAERQSYKLDLALDAHYVIELFSFPDFVTRPTRPEALGLRHLAFAVDDIESWHDRLCSLAVKTEPIRRDETTGKLLFFFFDPDDLPLEMYEE